MDERNLDGLKALETISALCLTALAAGLYFKWQPLLYIAGGLQLTGLVAKGISKRIASGWLRVAGALGTIITKVVLAMIFYGILTPLAFLYRLRHGDTLKIHERSAQAPTSWKERHHEYTPKDFENVW